MYDSGGYTPNLKEDPTVGISKIGWVPAVRVATISPTGATDSPDADIGDNELSQMGCT